MPTRGNKPKSFASRAQLRAPWYRRTTSFYVMSAKLEATRQRRLANLIACCAQQRRIGLLDRK